MSVQVALPNLCSVRGVPDPALHPHRTLVARLNCAPPDMPPQHRSSFADKSILTSRVEFIISLSAL